MIRVRLVAHTPSPFAVSVASARTCYSARGPVLPEDLLQEDAPRLSGNWKDLATQQVAERVAQITFHGGHHTVYQHATFTFAIEGVSRLLVWSFLHSHPFYNSEQVSQRYVRMRPDKVYTPSLSGEALSRFRRAVQRAFQTYEELTELLLPVVVARYRRLFPARDPTAPPWSREVRRKAREVARYVLPLATQTYLYHTVNALTLFRYQRAVALCDVPHEAGDLVGQMLDAVLRVEPEFRRFLGEGPEPEVRVQRDGRAVRELDRLLGNRRARLFNYGVRNTEAVVLALRLTLGRRREQLSQQDALERLLNPAENPLLGETMNLLFHSKVSRPLYHATYTFLKRLSHSADSQEQRHRMLFGSRPFLAYAVSDEPDYETPRLLREEPAAERRYHAFMEWLWTEIGHLRRAAGEEAAQYLLPNAVRVRILETGSLLFYMHKWIQRLCFNAQEEIYESTREEVLEVLSVQPELARYVGAPCFLRSLSGKRPFCPEGERYCGVPVWRWTVEEYQRTL